MKNLLDKIFPTLSDELIIVISLIIGLLVTASLILTFVVATCTIHSGYDRMVCFIALIIINIGLIATLIHRLYLMSHTTNTEIK